ncbi:hypothetical protein HY087_00330 [Candidatus Gottesmanbacteria bacterium]|nr:hypothetical protein [Candidatus Gottesmanbacteria bacterium]
MKGAGFIVWHARHEFYHILLGLAWAWFLRERWNEFNPRWVWWSLFASLLPDADHLLYFFIYGKKDTYSRQVRIFLKGGEWRNLAVFMENGHKNQTGLASHNYYIMSVLLGSALSSSLVEWRLGVILFGAMFIHYVFDIIDDLLMLGRINDNWKRWGRNATIYKSDKWKK